MIYYPPLPDSILDSVATTTRNESLNMSDSYGSLVSYSYADSRLVTFLSQTDTYSTHFSFRISASKEEVFETLLQSVIEIFGEDANRNFNFTSSRNYFIEQDELFILGRVDEFGRDHNAGNYNFTIYSSNGAKNTALRNLMIDKFSGRTVNSIVWAFAAPNGQIIYKEMDVAARQNEADETFYPWFKAAGMTLDEYAKNFLASEESVLLLMGVPGTGKTTFIKHLLVKHGLDAIITYDERLMRDDQFFLDFLTDQDGEDSGKDVLIIEDADALVADREKSDNHVLSKILNVSDGLIKNINKKIIFSTNITDIDDIDPALIRPGRCYDVIDFRKLTYEESGAVLQAKNLDRELVPGRSYTLAELVSANKRDQHTNKYKLGFNRG